MQKSKENRDSIDYYLNLAKSGVYPLFFKEWLQNSPSFNQSSRQRRKELIQFFKKMEKHNKTDRKKIAISAMKEEDRTRFISLFFEELENEILNEKYKYH